MLGWKMTTSMRFYQVSDQISRLKPEPSPANMAGDLGRITH